MQPEEQKKRGRPRIHPVKESQPKSPLKGRKYPEKWISGSDAYKHSMYMPWLRAKAQANFRSEGWDLSFEQFYELWKDDWNNRGRQPDNVCMGRKDYDEAWTVANTEVITRAQHLDRQRQLRRSEGSSYYKKGQPGRPGNTQPKIKYTKLKK